MMSYACENTFGETPTCKMKIGKKILLQEIDRAQVEKAADAEEDRSAARLRFDADAAQVFRLSRHGRGRKDHVRI